MALSTKLHEKIEGTNKFQAWNDRVMLIREEDDLEDFVKEEVPKPDENEAKEKYKNKLVKEKRIIVDSIKDHLIHHVSTLSNPKKFFDALSRLYEAKNMNRKMTLRTQLKR
jgi:hypothetical protein